MGSIFSIFQKPSAPPPPPASYLKCKYRLDNDSSATFELPDGRKLGYAQYGSLTGKPVIYCPGWPSSRIEGAYSDEPAKELGLRIISIDRPGFGWSSPQPNRTMLDYAKDVEHLTDHLGLEEYAVMGASGGGPYVLACAYALPAKKLKAAAIICGLGSRDMSYLGVALPNYLGWTWAIRLCPPLIRWWFARETVANFKVSDDKRLELVKKENPLSKQHPKDAALWTDDFLKMYLRNVRESYSQGMHGMSQDGQILASDFPFKIEDIRKDLPLTYWCGSLDMNVPVSHGPKVVAKMGGMARLIVKEETHLSIYFTSLDEALAWVRSKL